VIAHDWDPEKIAETYAYNGAAAISCLTDTRFFQGKLEYLTAIKERLRVIGKPVPVLRKDFLYHEYQVYEARMAGADAILLIVGVLGDNDLRRLRELAESLGMAALVEVHDEAEVARALKSGARIIGVNNRNLKTFAVDIETTGRLRPLIPAGRHPGRRERHPHRRRRAAHGRDGLRRHPGGRDLLQAAPGRARRQSEGVRPRRRYIERAALTGRPYRARQSAPAAVTRPSRNNQHGG
jgi:hypothetical protein